VSKKIRPVPVPVPVELATLAPPNVGDVTAHSKQNETSFESYYFYVGHDS
jgi:hypothetical protein